MAFLDLITGFGWGADAQTVAEGDGYAPPQVVIAISIDPSTVRVEFDQDMLEADVEGTVLNPDSYVILENLTSTRLTVLEVRPYSSTQVDLVTAYQKAVTYDLTVSNVLSAWGQPIDESANTDSFLGTAPTYQPASQMYTLYGVETGIQAEEQTNFEPDLDPPYLRNRDPFSGETDVSRTKILEFDILDRDTGVDLSTVVVEVDNDTAYTGATDTFSPPYDGVSSSVTPTIVDGYDGYHVAIQKTSEWFWDAVIPLRVVAYDHGGNLLDTSYSFQIEPDPTAPFIVAQSPAPDSTGNPRDGYVELAVVDKEGTLAGDSVRVDINGSPALDASTFELFYSPFDGPASALLAGTFDGYDGYGILLQRTSDFPSYGLVEVRVRAEDVSSNTLDQTYSFRIEDYTEPAFANVSPTPYSDNNPRNALVEFDVYDPGTGLDLTSMRVYIDGNTAYDGYGFLPPYDGYGSEVTGPFPFDGYDGYHVAVQSTGDYPSGGTVHVDVIISDKEGN